MKRKEHRLDPEDLEINLFEMRNILGDTYEHLDMYLENIFCSDCENPEKKKLIAYTPYLTNLNDLVLNGKCAGCGEIASRYIETGENPEKYAIAEEVRSFRKKKK